MNYLDVSLPEHSYETVLSESILEQALTVDGQDIGWLGSNEIDCGGNIRVVVIVRAGSSLWLPTVTRFMLVSVVLSWLPNPLIHTFSEFGPSMLWKQRTTIAAETID